MMGHLGARVSALLDGQLPPAEAEEAWRHVYGCHACRDLVEREGWVKSRLAGLAGAGDDAAPAPHDLKGSLMSLTPGDSYLVAPRESVVRRVGVGAAAVGGGAIGAALLGVVALGMAPGSGAGDVRQPISQVGTPTPGPTATPVLRPRRHSGERAIQVQRVVREILAPQVH